MCAVESNAWSQYHHAADSCPIHDTTEHRLRLTLARWTARAMVSGEAVVMAGGGGGGGGGVALLLPPFAALPHAILVVLPPFTAADGGVAAGVDDADGPTPSIKPSVAAVAAAALAGAGAGGSGEPHALPPPAATAAARPPRRPFVVGAGAAGSVPMTAFLD